MPSSRTDKILGYIGANVRRLRVARGWTQLELAQATRKTDGLKARYIQLLETGTANPTVKVLITLAEVLGVAATELFAVAKPVTRPTGRPPAAKPARSK